MSGARPSQILHPINALLLVHGALLLGFDYLASGLRLGLAGALLCGYGGVVALSLGGGHKALGWRELAPLGVILGCWALAMTFQRSGPGNDGLEAALRQLATYASLLALLAARAAIAPAVLIALALGILLSGLAHALALPPEMLNGRPRWAPFSANLHSSGYGFVAALLVILHLRERGRLGAVWAALAGLGLIVLLAGNGVRTPVVFLGTYLLLGLAALPGRTGGPSVPAVFMLGVAGVLAVLALSLIGGDRLDDLASGRLSNYSQRIGLIWERAPGAFLIGTGPGSDLMRTTVWWWEEKGSHSDLLKALWEAGLLGSLAVLWFWGSLAARFGGTIWALSGAVIVSSAVSNAYLARPNVAFVLFACAAARLAWQERQHGTALGPSPTRPTPMHGAAG